MNQAEAVVQAAHEAKFSSEKVHHKALGDIIEKNNYQKMLHKKDTRANVAAVNFVIEMF